MGEQVCCRSQTAATTAGADGTWTLEVRIAPDVAVGEHSLQAEGTSSAGVDRSIRATLLVADPTPVVVLPESGTDLDMMNYAILIAALGAMLALLATGTRRRFM